MDLETHLEKFTLAVEKNRQVVEQCVNLANRILARIEAIEELQGTLEHQIFPNGHRPDDLPLFTALTEFFDNSRSQYRDWELRVSNMEKDTAELISRFQRFDEE